MIDIKFLLPYRQTVAFAMGCIIAGSIVFGERVWFQQSEREWGEQLAEIEPEEVAGYVSVDIGRIDFDPMDADIVLAAPLFIQGREPVATLDQVNSSGDGQLKLTGVILAPQGWVALLRDDKNNHFRLKEGDSVYGWSVNRIEREKVSLTKGVQVKEIPLVVASDADVVPPSPAFEQFSPLPSDGSPGLLMPNQPPRI